jgi:hypothetical protein
LKLGPFMLTPEQVSNKLNILNWKKYFKWIFFYKHRLGSE